MDQQLVEYLLKREAQELEAMASGGDEKSVEIHRQMAAR